MDREQFEALVTRMEEVARAHPAAYRWRVLGWAALGFGFLALVVLVLLAAFVATIASVNYLKAFSIKLLVIVVPALFVVVRSLWVRFNPPDGPRVTRREAPQLFAMLDELRTSLRTPPIHAVVITHELNAAVTQIPRLGFLGWHRNFLMLGLPLMKGLTVEQFKAVLGHELGHLSRGHARLGNWIYRLRMIWARLDDEYSRTSRLGATAIRRFFHWYSPRFNATSFPLARANEYEADAAAARVTSPQSAAQALTGISVLARFLDQNYWPDIHKAARDRPEPSFSPYSAFHGSALVAIPENERSRWLSGELARATSIADTHPALKDRLAAIGGEPCFAPPVDGSGAEVLLGNALPRLEQHFDNAWRQQVAGSWKEFHERAQEARARLAKIRNQGERSDEGCDELLERADLEEQVGEGGERALELRRTAAQRFPESSRARYALGRQLLKLDDPGGVPLVESLINEYPVGAAEICEMLRDYFWRRGDHAIARQWHERLVTCAQRVEEARRERDSLHVTDTFLPHELPEADLGKIVQALKGIPYIQKVFLVRKEVRHFPEMPMYVLGYTCSNRLLGSDQVRASGVMEEIKKAVEFPGETLIISVEGENWRFESAVCRAAGARIL